MAQDLKLVWNDELGEADLNFINNDFEMDGRMSTAIYISLFTDQRAANDDDIDDPDDRRGWWGDLTSGIMDDRIGSKLWQLMRAKTTMETLVLAKQYIESALKWMLEDGVCADIEVEVGRAKNDAGDDVLAALIKIIKDDGTTISYTFDDLWNAQFEEV